MMTADFLEIASRHAISHRTTPHALFWEFFEGNKFCYGVCLSGRFRSQRLLGSANVKMTFMSKAAGDALEVLGL